MKNKILNQIYNERFDVVLNYNLKRTKKIIYMCLTCMFFLLNLLFIVYSNMIKYSFPPDIDFLYSFFVAISFLGPLFLIVKNPVEIDNKTECSWLNTDIEKDLLSNKELIILLENLDESLIVNILKRNNGTIKYSDLKKIDELIINN